MFPPIPTACCTSSVKDPVALRHLYGTDDEGAVFFLVSRGLAERRNNHLAITEKGRDLGQIATPSTPMSTR